MKPVLFVLAMLIMAFVIVVLVLNILDRDAFDGGSLTLPSGSGPDPIAAGLLPATVSHQCPTCGECVHAVEIVENKRTLTLKDHRPWYKLTATGDRTVYFDDPVYLAACLKNRSAREPQGMWRIIARIGRPAHPPTQPHVCLVVSEVRLAYQLKVSEAPIADVQTPLTPSLQIGQSVQAFIYHYDAPRLAPILHFVWDCSMHIYSEDNCSCGKP